MVTSLLSLVVASAFASVPAPFAPFVTPLSWPSALSSLLLPTDAKSALTAKHCAKPAHVTDLTAYLVRNMRATRADPAVAMAAIARCAQALPPSPPAAPRRTNFGKSPSASATIESNTSSSTYPSLRNPSSTSVAGPDTASHGSPRATSAHSSSVRLAPRSVRLHCLITAAAASAAVRRTDGLRCETAGVNAAASACSTLGAVSFSHRAVRRTLRWAAAWDVSAPAGGGPSDATSSSSSSSSSSTLEELSRRTEAPSLPSSAILLNLSTTSSPASPPSVSLC